MYTMPRVAARYCLVVRLVPLPVLQQLLGEWSSPCILKILEAPFEGMHCSVPWCPSRYATEVYFHTATEEQQLSLYNLLYSSTFGGPSTLEDVLEREANRVVGEAMMTLRHDPHMMHQVRV
jgi:hypothetical protein